MVGELKRSKEILKEDVQRIREWLDKQPHLPHDVDDEVITAFVFATKTLENAKRRLDNYYSARNRAPELFDWNCRLESITTCRNAYYGLEQFYLPKLTDDGYRVMFLLPNEDFEKKFVHPMECARFFSLVELGMKLWPEGAGYIFVVDVKGQTSTVATKISATLLALAIRVLSNSYPVKIKGIYFTNAPSFIEFLVNTLLKPFMKEKIQNRVHVFSDDMSAIKEHLPLEILPSNYGGNEKTSSELDDYWLDQLEKNKDWIKHSCEQSVNEKKRPADSANTYGINGTFRKLAVD